MNFVLTYFPTFLLVYHSFTKILAIKSILAAFLRRNLLDFISNPWLIFRAAKVACCDVIL